MVTFFNLTGLLTFLAAVACFAQGIVLADIAAVCLMICTAVYWVGAAILHEMREQHQARIQRPAEHRPPILNERVIQRGPAMLDPHNKGGAAR